MNAIVTEWNTFSTDDARDLVNAAQVLLKGDQNDVRILPLGKSRYLGT